MKYFLLFSLLFFHSRCKQLMDTGNYSNPVSGHRINGTQCTHHAQCGRNIHCKNGFCTCRTGDHHLTFDKIQKTCATIAGESCSEHYPCVSNANCDPVTAKCTCELNEFSATSFGECRLNYGIECSRPGIYCNAEKFLGCNLESNVCTCANDAEQIYNAVSGSCLVRPMERCELVEYGITSNCVPNAKCVNDTTPAEFGVCTCVEGYQRTDSACLPLYGNPCNLDDACAPGRNLECSVPEFGLRPICTCQSGRFNESVQACQEDTTINCGDSSTIDRALNICRVKANYPCDIATDICTRDAVCENGVCQCSRYYFPTLDGRCQFLFEASESRQSGCDAETLLKCLHCHCLPSDSSMQTTKNCSSIFKICEPHLDVLFAQSKCPELDSIKSSDPFNEVVMATSNAMKTEPHTTSQSDSISANPKIHSMILYLLLLGYDKCF